VSEGVVDKKLYRRWQDAEEAIYAPETGDPLLNWEHATWRQLFQAAGFEVQIESTMSIQEIYVTPKLLERWFSQHQPILSYGDRLRHHLSQKDLDKVRAIMTQHLEYQSVPWKSTHLYIQAHNSLVARPLPSRIEQ
jgi:hypothetical protein